MAAYINSIGTAVPGFKVSQDEVLHFMQRAHGMNNGQANKLAVLYRATGIQSRYSVLEDYKKSEGFSFFPDNKNLSPFPTTRHRARVFEREAIKLSVRAVKSCLQQIQYLDEKDITHLITVTCTGLVAPGLDIELVNALGLSKNIKRTGVNFMGCYAAFNALKLAEAFCTSDPTAKVLVVCTELCSLHFQKEQTEDNLLANALFGDGSAALVVTPSRGHGLSFELDKFHCDLLTNGRDEMAWSIGNTGFEMRLSAYVPDVIASGIHKLIDQLKTKLEKLDFDYYAIHPGGKKILKVLEEALHIDRQDNRFAYEVLKSYGNMSSPTILFVLKQIFEELSPTDQDKKILSFAFGPGLTLESMTLNVCYAK
ncbi:MAG: type III polyketide synthase [Fulvivirga sp.]|nr:type III polyketide synthase [Fulvivirga sp.]